MFNFLILSRIIKAVYTLISQAETKKIFIMKVIYHPYMYIASIKKNGSQFLYIETYRNLALPQGPTGFQPLGPGMKENRDDSSLIKNISLCPVVERKKRKRIE